MKTLLIAPLALLLMATSSHAVVYLLSGSMDPQQAGTNGGFGVGTGSGTGTISGDYNSDSNILNYTISWQNLTSPTTVAHFHVGAPGASGGVTLGIVATSPSVGGPIALNATQESELLGGLWYVNIHTQNFTGGEIRGQVIVTPVPEPSTSVLALGMLGAFFIRRRHH